MPPPAEWNVHRFAGTEQKGAIKSKSSLLWWEMSFGVTLVQPAQGQSVPSASDLIPTVFPSEQ